MKSNFALVLAGGLAALTACSPSASLTKKADKKFKEQAAYNEAADLYKQALDKGGDKKYLNAMIAESYRLSNRPAMAAPYYKAALDSKNTADSIKFYYAQSLKAAGQSDEAKTAFDNYAKNGRRQRWKDRAKMEAGNIDKIGTLPNKADDYEIRNLDNINTAAGEYSPAVAGDEFVYTGASGSRIYGQTGTPFTDLMGIKTVDLGNQGIKAAPLGKVNTDDRHEASASFSEDGKLMVFARSNDGSRKGATDVDLYQSKKGADGAWSDPELLNVSSPTAWDAYPALSPDGKTLYFSSNREGGKGGLDLYRATLDPATGKWAKPTNLGESINTAGDEMAPSVTKDGKLYFSSDGLPGFGGQDIFIATRNKEEGTKVENLGMPLNSKGDDFGIVYLPNGYEGYLASNREGGKGDDDIYYFKNLIAEPKIVHYNVKGTLSGNTNGKNEGPIGGAHVKITDAAGQPVAEATTDDQGNFSFAADEDKQFNFLMEKEGYFAKRDNFSTANKRPPARELRQKENTVDLTYANSLDKIKLEQAITIDNIYYDYDRANVRPEAAAELDKVVTMLNDNPAITIELSSHTDSRGDDAYNMRLSQMRADSAVHYIVGKGVPRQRIYAKGYGESKPIVPNAATEDEFQKNRRTEFKVTKIAHTQTKTETTGSTEDKKKKGAKAPAKKPSKKK